MHKTQATVPTAKASRYLKALCNHFDRKVSATCDDALGKVEFGFAYCEMRASEGALVIDIESEDQDGFERAKYVVDDHLTRFAPQEAFEIVWQDES